MFADRGIGTTFLPAPKPVTGRKRWILSLAPGGSLVLDAGAVEAVVGGRKSLFPAGVKAVTGDFDAQDAVVLLDASGHELARALVNYGADDCRRLMGHNSKQIASVLGYLGAETLADRDNIVLLHAPTRSRDAGAIGDGASTIGRVQHGGDATASSGSGAVASSFPAAP